MYLRVKCILRDRASLEVTVTINRGDHPARVAVSSEAARVLPTEGSSTVVVLREAFLLEDSP